MSDEFTMNIPRASKDAVIVDQQYLALLHSLTPIQKEHFDSICWLLDFNGRQRGRSYLMALGFIHVAILNPGRLIQTWDHPIGNNEGVLLPNNNTINRHLRHMIQNISDFELSENHIILKSKSAVTRQDLEKRIPDGVPNFLNNLKKSIVQAIQSGYTINEIEKTVNEGIVQSTLEE